MKNAPDDNQDGWQNDWESCPPGTFSQLGQQEKNRRTGSSPFQVGPFPAGIVVGALACFLFAAYSWLSPGPSTTTPLGSPSAVMLTCSEVVPHLHDYKAGTLTKVRMIQFKNHLAGCASCRAKLSELSVQGEMNAWLAGGSIDLRPSLEKTGLLALRL